jgi:hypothetical protein
MGATRSGALDCELDFTRCGAVPTRGSSFPIALGAECPARSTLVRVNDVTSTSPSPMPSTSSLVMSSSLSGLRKPCGETRRVALDLPSRRPSASESGLQTNHYLRGPSMIANLF